MNKKICTMIAGMIIVAAGSVFAQENLLKNSELKLDNNGQLTNWSGNCKFNQDTGYKGLNSVYVILEKREASPGVQMGKGVIAQRVGDLKPGKYIFSVYIKEDRKIRELLLCRIIKLDGKDAYQTTLLKASEQPELDTWTKIMAEFDIPEGTDSATIALDLRDVASGATFWVDSPVLTYKSE